MPTRRSLLRAMPAAAALPYATLAYAKSPRTRLLIGTGTGEKSSSKGIYMADWHAVTGTLGDITLAAELESPTWLAIAPATPHLYAISEATEGKVTAFALRHGKGDVLSLEHLNQQPSGGAGPAHVSTAPDGRSVFVANYGGGSLTSYKVERSGALSSPVSRFQYTPIDSTPEHAKPHAHEATPSPDGRWLLVNDLGSDRIFVYRIGLDGKLTPNSPGFWQGRLKSGPRHLTFHPNGRWVYNVNELDSTVDLLYWNAQAGTLTSHGTFVSTLPPGFPPNTAFCSEVLTSPDGRFVYVGNRRNETIAVLDVNPATGELVLSQLAPHGGKTARHVTLDPTGRFLLVACQDSGAIVVMARDARSGRLSEPRHSIPISSPQCLIFTD